MESGLSWILFALFIAAMWHYFWDCIITPNWRLQKRIELFALRDETRALMSEHREDAEDLETCRLLQGSINSAINVMAYLSITMLADVRRLMASKPDLASEIESNLRRLNSSKLTKERMQRVQRITLHAFVVNSCGWLIYIVPIAFVFLCLKRTSAIAKSIISMPSDVLSGSTNKFEAASRGYRPAMVREYA